MKKSIAFLVPPCTSLLLILSMVAPAPVMAQTASASCYTFTRNLGEGRPLNTQEAQALGQALMNASVWNAGTPITIFNDDVASAVSGFQEKYAAQILNPNGLSYGTGYVGASTRAELNSLYGCTSPNTSPQAGFQGCPVGWICTPPVQTSVTYACPTGWTCAPIGNTVTPPPTTSVATTIPVNGLPVADAGGSFALPAVPTLAKQVGASDLSGNYLATYTAIFNVQVTAGTNVILGLPGSSLPAIIVDNSFISIFKNSADINGHSEPLANYNPIITYSSPANSTLSTDGKFFTIGANQTATVPVSVSFTVKNPWSDVYAVALRAVVWTSSAGGQIHRSSLSAQNSPNTLMTAAI